MTAPRFGFSSTKDYYAQCSTREQLSRIPADAHHTDALHVLRTRHGGHVGFVGGSVLHPQVLTWLQTRVPR